MNRLPRSLKSLLVRLTKLGQTPLIQNFSWMVAAEFLSRSSRFVTLFVLAAFFSNAQYGLAMLALALHELLRVITRLGTGAKIIQCAPEVLQATLQNAATLNWLVSIAVAIIQISVAELVAHFYQMPDLAMMLKVMALSHLLYPIVAIRIFEQHRQNKMRFYGIASGMSIAFENLLVAALVFLNSTVIMIAVSKVAAAALWVIMFYHLPTNLKRNSWDWAVQRSLLSFSLKTLTSELSRMMRFQSDSLIAGKLLSPEAFGLYSFAKSAGLGIAQSFSQAYLSALYPYLCQQFRAIKNIADDFSLNAWWCTLLAGACFGAQVLLAPWYIEWLFNERWVEASTTAAILCLVAIPQVFVDHLGLSFRAQNKTSTELKIMLFCSHSLFAGLLLVQPETAATTAITMACCSGLWLLTFIVKIKDIKLGLRRGEFLSKIFNQRGTESV